MSKIIRSVFIAITEVDKQGKTTLKLRKETITRVNLDDYIKDYRWRESPDEKNQMQQEKTERERAISMPKVTTLNDRLSLQKFLAKEGRHDRP